MEEPRASLRGDVSDVETKHADNVSTSCGQVASADVLTSDFSLGEIPTLCSLLSPQPSEQNGGVYGGDLSDTMLESPKLVATHDEHLSLETKLVGGPVKSCDACVEVDSLVAVGAAEMGEGQNLDEGSNLEEDLPPVVQQESPDEDEDACKVKSQGAVCDSDLKELEGSGSEVEIEEDSCVPQVDNLGTESSDRIVEIMDATELDDPTSPGTVANKVSPKEEVHETPGNAVEDSILKDPEEDGGAGQSGMKVQTPNEEEVVEAPDHLGKRVHEVENGEERQRVVEVRHENVEESEDRAKTNEKVVETEADENKQEVIEAGTDGKLQEDSLEKIGGSDEIMEQSEGPSEVGKQYKTLTEEASVSSARNEAEDEEEDSDEEGAALPFGLKITSVETLADTKPFQSPSTVNVKYEDFEVEIERSPSSNGDDGGAEMVAEFGDQAAYDDDGTDALVVSFQAFVQQKLATSGNKVSLPALPPAIPRSMQKAPNEKEYYTCPQCNKLFPTRYLFKKHRSRTHQKNFVLCLDDIGHQTHCFRCSICSKGFIGKGPLGQHRREKHNITVVNEKMCGICYKVSASPAERFLHEFVEHGLKAGDPHAQPVMAQAPRASITIRQPQAINQSVRLRPLTHVLRQPPPMNPNIRQPQLVHSRFHFLQNVNPGLQHEHPNSNNRSVSMTNLPVNGGHHPPGPQSINRIGKISIRPTHSLQNPGVTMPMGPRMMGSIQVRGPVYSNGYGMMPQPSPRPLVAYVMPAGAASPVAQFMSANPVVDSRLARSILPKNFACATCRSEFSTAVNLKLHAAAMGHLMPAGLEDVGDANTASVMNVICAPGADEVGMEDVPEHAGSYNGASSLNQEHSWVRGSTEIKKRKQGQDDDDDVVVIDDDDSPPPARPTQPSMTRGRPAKIRRISPPDSAQLQPKKPPQRHAVGPSPRPVMNANSLGNTTGTRTSCPVCPKGPMNTFTSPSHLLIHMRVAHRDSPATTNGGKAESSKPPPNHLKKQRLLPASQRTAGNSMHPSTSDSSSIEVIDLV